VRGSLRSLVAAAESTTVLAPNAELAAALFDAVERTQRNAGRDVWPTPRVRDFASWLREQHLKRQLEDADSPRLLGDAEERELWRGAIDAAEFGRDLLDPAGAARAARHARRTLSDYGIPLRALKSEGSEEVRAFLAWNGAFEEQCRALNCISADALLDGIAAPRTAVTWIESPAWRPAARRWLLRHGRVLAPQAAKSHSASYVSAPSPGAELAAIAEWTRTSLRAHPLFRAWICVPDLAGRRAEVVDALDAALAPQRFGLGGEVGAAPYAVAGGTPLADYAPVRAALEALAVGIGSMAFARFSALLRSPELQADHAEASAAARLDVALRSRATREADFRAWLELAEGVARREEIGAVAAVQRLQAMQHATGEVRGAHRFSVWVSIWLGALEAGPWALRARWSSTEYQAAERFRELLATLATADALLGTHSRESALRVLRRAARDTAFQVQTGVAAVWVSGQLIDPWLNYDGLWVAGCDDAQWPPRIAPVALLPVGLQRQYGVIAASTESQAATAVDLQSRWQLRAGQCVFSYADAPDGTKSLPSPLLPKNEALLLTAMPPVPQPHWRELLQSAPAMESLSDDWAPPFSVSHERTRGVSSLRAQSRCAFRGFAETRLDAHRLEPVVPGFNEHERGILVHEALEHVWSILPGSHALHSLSSDAQQRLLADAARRAIEKVCKKRDPGPTWRRREDVRLQNLLGKWLDIERTRAPFTVEAVEQGAADVHFGGLTFKVRIDRVDRLEDGARVLLDYKTGNASADWRGERPHNPQLPVYALVHPQALVAVAYARVNAGEPGFVSESERRDVFKPGGRQSNLEGMANFADLVRTWSLRVERIAAEFASGRAEVAPTLKACERCDLQGLCRVPAALEPEDG
jgi:ATP-dependent helicase/nuclease subunit B